MPTTADNEYRYAAELAQDANHEAESGRKIYSRYSYLKDRMIEWDRTIAPQRATVVAFVILFPAIAIVEYLFSEELYRDVLPKYPWAMGLIFAILAVVIAEMLVYRFFEVKRQWKANELKRSEKWKSQPEELVDRHIRKMTRRQFIIGLFLFLIMVGVLSYVSWDRVKRMVNAGERTSSFGPIDVLPMVLYVFEVITGMFIWYVFLRLELGYTVLRLKKKFDRAVKRCSEFTINAVQSFNRAENLGYDIFQKPVTGSIHEAFCRNASLTEANGIEYISEQESDVFPVKFRLFHKGTNTPFIGNIKVTTSYKFTHSAGTKNGNLDIKLATFLHFNPQPGNRTGDFIQSVSVDVNNDGKPSESVVSLSIDLDSEGPHDVFV